MNPLDVDSFVSDANNRRSRLFRITASASLACNLGTRLAWLEGIKRTRFVLLYVENAIQLSHLQ
jgi:hypothetical protein